MDCVQCQFQYVVIANCVLCGFSIGNEPRRHRPPVGAASQFMLNQYYCYWAPATRHPGATFTNLQYGASTSAPFTNLKCVLLQEHRSPISSVAPSTSVHRFPFLRLIECTTHQSPVLHLPRGCADLHSCASTSAAPFTDLQCCTFYKCCTHCHCCASTVAPFYSVAPFVSYYFMPSDYATIRFYIINNLTTGVNTPC